METRILGECHAAAAFCAAILAAGCASGPSSPPPSPGRAADSARRCEQGTLGLEVHAPSRPLRRKLGLKDGFKGAIVADALPGGPAAAAGIRPDDIVEEVGSASIANDCELLDAGYNLRSCDPVRIMLRRGGSPVEATLVPVDQNAFLDKSCREGNATSCFRLGWTLWSRGRPADRDRALELYQAACQAGSAEACANEGLRLMDAADRGKEAVAALERSCELGSGGGCATLAFLHATGKLVARNDHRATPLYVKACDLGDSQGCYNVGLMAEDGRGGAHDVSLAAGRYAEACGMGSSPACTNLGFLYENGRGVPMDKARAVALYRGGCDGSRCVPSNLAGCVNVGRAYRDGMGVVKSEERAAALFEEACRRKPHPEDVDAEQVGSRACSLLGALYLAGDGIPKDLARGRELSEKGCERGDSFGCFNAAAVYRGGTGVPADLAKAASYLDRACKAGDAEGCHDLATAYEKGTGVTRDHRRAAELMRRACELGFAKDCPKKK